MPLLDHFQPPLKDFRSWDAFHSRWATAIADTLNMGLLATGYFAEALATLGRIEVDVSVEKESHNGVPFAPNLSSSGNVATVAAPVWAPAPHTMEMDAEYPPAIQVLVFRETARTLVGAIELVSPGNKDRPAARRAFAVKCLSYLQAGIGLIIADIVTERAANLHDEIAELIIGDAPRFPGTAKLYAAAYRPFRLADEGKIAVWPVPLQLDEPLPVLPLWLREVEEPVRIDLEAAYTEARQRCLIP